MICIRISAFNALTDDLIALIDLIHDLSCVCLATNVASVFPFWLRNQLQAMYIDSLSNSC